MKIKIHFLKMMLVLMIISNLTIAQSECEKNLNLIKNNIYIPSVERYCKIIQINLWNEKNIENYRGKYEYIFHPYDENGEWHGDGVLSQMSVSISDNNIILMEIIMLEDWNETENQNIYSGKFSNPLNLNNNDGFFY